MNSLKISIITVVYNGENYIEETIKSVLKQTYPHIEYIVIDGKSTDNTINIVNIYREQISTIISEFDNSMYEAINKGIAIATGSYMLILNSDDSLVGKNTLTEVITYITTNPGYLAYYGNILKNKDNHITKRRVFQVSQSILISTKHGTLLPHPALFVNRIESLKKIGMYDTTYKYAADFDYILRLLEEGAVKYMNIYVTMFREHAGSITASGNIESDRLKILKKYDSKKLKFIKSVEYVAIWSLYKFLNIIINVFTNTKPYTK